MIINGISFPSVPTQLQLYGMEERIISPRLLFFQMRTHFMGGRTQVLGNVVNVPVDVAPTVQTLPRTLSDMETLVVKYKQKLEYKKCEFQENIRPYAVWRAAHYLLQNSNIYKNENIQLNTDWLSISDGSGSLIKEVEVFDPISEHLCDDDNEINIVTKADTSKAATCEANSVVIQSHIRNVNSHMSPIQYNDSSNNNNTNVQSNSRKNDNINQLNMHTQDVQNLNNDIIEIGDLNEVDEDSNAIHHDTLLHEEDIPHADPESFPHELIYAPGEGRTPKSIFQDANVEYLAFPTIFCGQRRKENQYKVNYSDVYKYEL